MGDVRQEADYVTSQNRAYRFLTIAVVTKFASFLTGIGQFRTSLWLTGETAAPEELMEGGLLQMLATADGLMSLAAVIFFCLWLARASAGGVVTLAKEGLPRRMGVLCVAGVLASVLANFVSLGSVFGQMAVLFRHLAPLQEGAAAPIRIPHELPVLYFKVQSLTLLVTSVLQLLVFAFFRTLIRRSAEAEAPVVEDPAQVPAEAVPSPESDTGFGWPEQPAE